MRRLMEIHSIAPKQLAKVLRVSITMLNNYTYCILEPDFDTLKHKRHFLRCV